MRKKTQKGADEKRSAALSRGGRRLASLGLPADADCRLPQITLTGKSYLRVEHHLGVLQLTECRVRLYTALGVLRIDGSGLAAASMDGDVMLLDGCIRSVSFE
ncbi:MAG: YabP/YqfC family sporulation protein [Clostridia bacterium]|nr:YabP/YqfC family sporulation protein [Clostridia bacterium]